MDLRLVFGVLTRSAGPAGNGAAAAVRLAHHQADTYRLFRQEFGQTILLGPELLVGGDIICTVASPPTLASIAGTDARRRRPAG